MSRAVEQPTAGLWPQRAQSAQRSRAGWVRCHRDADMSLCLESFSEPQMGADVLRRASDGSGPILEVLRDAGWRFHLTRSGGDARPVPA